MHCQGSFPCLRTFAPKMFPRTDFFWNWPGRKVMIYFCQKSKKWGFTDLVLERTCPEGYSKSEKKNRAPLAANKATVSSPKILQLDLWSKILSPELKLTYFNCWGSLKNKLYLATIFSRAFQPQDGRIPCPVYRSLKTSHIDFLFEFLSNVEIIVNKMRFSKEK